VDSPAVASRDSPDSGDLDLDLDSKVVRARWDMEATNSAGITEAGGVEGDGSPGVNFIVWKTILDSRRVWLMRRFIANGMRTQ
jgi:hypothetical protein